MDAWRYIVRSENGRTPLDSYLPIILSAAGALGILPFAVLRFMQEAWIAAVLDTVIMVGFLALGAYVYRTHKARIATFLSAMRHFRDELIEKDIEVHYHELPAKKSKDRGESFSTILKKDVKKLKPDKLVIVLPGDQNDYRRRDHEDCDRHHRALHWTPR